MIDRIRRIKDAANADVGAFLRMLYDYDIPKPSSEWKMGDLHGAGGDSLTVWPNGTWKDFATHEGGDLLDLAELHWQCTKATAYDRLETALGLESQTFRSPHPIDYSNDLHELDELEDKLTQLSFRTAELFQETEVKVTQKAPLTQVSLVSETILPPWSPSPEEDPWTSGALKVKGQIVRIWAYHTKEGQVCFWVCRYMVAGKKRFTVAYWSKTGWVNKKPQMESYPLLDIHYFWALRDKDTDTTIVLVEGEKAAETGNALKMPGFWFTTWHGGASGTKNQDFMVLAGRRIILWPDKDLPGKQAMAGIYSHLNGQAYMHILDTHKDWAEGDDVADISDRFGADYVYALLTSAQSKISGDLKDDLPDEYREPNQLGSIYRLIHRYGKNIKASAERGEWYIYRDGWWQHDQGSIQVYAYARSIVESTFRDCLSNNPKDVESYSNRAKTNGHIMGILEGAAKFQEVAVSENDFDPSPDHIACANGLLDLRTGEIRSLRQEDMISKIIPFKYSKDAECPKFEQFLDQILCETPKLKQFLQDFFGYSLTGNPPDRIFPIFYGTGKNGKSTLLNIIQVIMGDYHVATRTESIMATDKPDKIGEDIIPLRGARLATMQESERGGKINEAKIKGLTGRDRLRCRYLHSNTWLEWTNTAKIILSTNYKPRISGIDKGIWDRVALVGFDYRIRESEEDSDLHVKILNEEAEGVLAWMVKGAMRYYKAGKKIHRPAEIVTNTAEYHSEENVIGSYVDDRLMFADTVRIGASALYLDYKRWMEDRGDGAVVSHRNFTEQASAYLKDLNVKKHRVAAGWVYLGIGLKQASLVDDTVPY